MKLGWVFGAGLGLAVALGGAAIGQDANKAAMDAVKARKAHMQLNAYNLGLLGGMAKGEIEYDAGAASAAAANLASLAKLDQSRYWLPGTDTDTLGDEATTALPAIWAADSKVGESAQALTEAADALASDAGNGLEALQAGMGPVGKACGSCHETYRKAKN